MTTIKNLQKLYIKSKAKFSNFIKVKILNENLTIKQPQRKAKKFYNLAG